MNKEENHKKSTRRRFPNHPHQYHKALASLFHTHKQPDPTESGHDGPPMAANVASSRGSMREKSITPPDSLSSSSLVRPAPLQATQLLLVPSSSSHVPPPPPPRSRSNTSLTQSSLSMAFTDNDRSSSLRSAYSNEDDGGIHADPPPSSLNRSDRLQIYHFGTPTGANQYHDHDDYASSRFSYDAQSQLHSSSSRYNNQDQRRQQKQRSRTPLSYLKRSYFSSSFASSGKRKSVASQPVDHTATTPSSSSSSSVRRTVGHRASHILFLGRRLPDFETLVYCSECEKWIQSRLRYRNGSMVWLAAFVL
ncbi:hypothetical protein [Absidia glauca]|uniref:LITAF domain-containing protein n=1 Tax=Absidia glauca TaxID=4829 RepID=A0A168QE38_ABSGL|nr:hypothetical protein [Absidia glauca]